MIKQDLFLKFNEDFKVALADLPGVEKDRLLWRLIKRDELLARRLEFELLAPYSAIDKRNELVKLIQNKMLLYCKKGWQLSEILTQCRGFSGDITRHVYITKDKVGEIWLNFVLLQEAFALLNNPAFRFSWRSAQKYVMYMVNKLFRVCMLMEKLHVDFYIELEDEARKLGKIMQANSDLMEYVKHHKFNVHWLLDFDIPDDLDKYYKAVKQQGLLK